MGSRRTGQDSENVYAAAKAWVDRALRADDSLFTPGNPIWSSENLAELRERFLDRPDYGSPPFYDQLRQQLENSPPEVYQLMGEVLYVHFLISGPMKRAAKQDRISQVLGMSPEPVNIPPALADALQIWFINIGAGAAKIPFQVGTLIEVIEQWKELESQERDRLLNDPWAFKDFLFTRHFTGQLLVNNQNSGGIEKDILLHIVFPDEFEAIGPTHKQRIANAQNFAHFIKEPTNDVDRKIMQIREGLEAEYGESFNFYDSQIRARWDPNYQPDPWDDFVHRAQAYVGSGRLEPDENEYKLSIGSKLAQARAAVLHSNDAWPNLVKSGLVSNNNNLVHFVQLAKIRGWIDNSPDAALKALRAVWSENESTVSERIRGLCALLPSSAASGAGTRMNVISVLLMGLDVEQYPPFRVRVFNKAYVRTGYRGPGPGADEAALYEHALGFLDQFIKEAAERGLNLRHHLDAQSVVWGILADDDDPPPPPPPDDLEALGKKLYLPTEFLEEISTLLEEKKQVIFQGPPGTGKTFVAQEIAERLAGSGRVTLVQFHPSYAYEDFVQGYRPALIDGQPGFKLTDGPLLKAARSAAADHDTKHFLIIDEINRGNLAKVFGELYFLLEYREKEINLQYADAPFRLPPNLYVIGDYEHR